MSLLRQCDAASPSWDADLTSSSQAISGEGRVVRDKGKGDLVISNGGQEMPAKRKGVSEQVAHKGCCHHWVIGPADGATSKGRCRLCGKEREFRNDMQACLEGNGDDRNYRRRPVKQIRHQVQDGPLCQKCNRPMVLETWFGIGVRLFWLCTSCNIRRPPFAL